jgi:hypothetical protein
MRKEKALIDLLRGLVGILAEEADRNPEFAAKIEGLLSELPERKVAPKKTSTYPPRESLPDIHLEWSARGETDFRLWLREQSIPILRAIIRAQDFDPTRRTTKWKEAEKLAEFIADGLRARLSRGSAFIGKGDTSDHIE